MSAAAPAAGARVGERFELVERVFDRGCGEAWRARDRDFATRQSLVALLRPGGDLDALQGLVQRLRALRHPGLVTPVACGRWEDRPFVASPWCDGAPLVAALDERAAAGAEAPRAIVERLTDDLCAALGALHGAAPPLAHGALHPGCVLLGRGAGGAFDLRLIDAALAPFADPGAGDLYPDCAAPERAEGHGPHPAADIYAAAMVLRRVLREPSAARAWAAPFEGYRGRRDVPAEVWEVIGRASARRRDDRYPTADALREALRRAWRSPRRAPTERPAVKREAPPTPKGRPPPRAAEAAGDVPSASAAPAEANPWATAVLRREVSLPSVPEALRARAAEVTLADAPPPRENPWATDVLRAPVLLEEEMFPTVALRVDAPPAAPPPAAPPPRSGEAPRPPEPRAARRTQTLALAALAAFIAAALLAAAWIHGVKP